LRLAARLGLPEAPAVADAGQTVTNAHSTDVAETERRLAAARTLASRLAAQVRTQFSARVRRVRLFGSAARGDYSADSDIDVLVTLEPVQPDDREWIARRAFALGVLETGLVLQPVVMGEAEFSRPRARERLFALDVEREGMEL